MAVIDYFICAAYNPRTGLTGTLWLVMPVKRDYYKSGDSIIVKGKEYILGRRDLVRGEISSYELILRSEVLELT
jgi:hypothetical protein